MTDLDDLLEQPLFRYAGHLDVHQRLRLACRYSDMNGVTAFLKQGADPNGSDEQGRTAWEASIWSGNSMALNLLLASWSAPPELVKQAETLGSHEEIMEVLQTYGLAEPGPEKSWSIEDINQAIELMEDCREQFGIEAGNDRCWGYVPFLSDVSVFDNEYVLPGDVSGVLERNDPLRASLGALVMDSRGVVILHSETEAPKLLLSPAMAKEFAPRLFREAAPDESQGSVITPKRMKH